MGEMEGGVLLGTIGRMGRAGNEARRRWERDGRKMDEQG